MTILVYILLICFIMSEGVREAYCDSLLTVDYGKYKHYLFSACRLFVFSIAFIYTWRVIFIILMFPFLHDGIYYTIRNVLSKTTPYRLWWFDQGSTTITSKIFNKYVRTTLFIIGVVLILL